jgi:uncharacterized protein YndB with AHSA1/START domain
MLIKILLTLLILIVVFLGYVATQPSAFNYERSGVIAATPDKIFPYISDFRKGNLWSPYAAKDPNMKMTYRGPEGQVGSIADFEGNSEAGTGSLEIVKIVPNQLVEIKLKMTKPIAVENLVTYKLIPEDNGTRFSWSMSGEGGYLGKLMGVLIDCEKLFTKDLIVGIANLKTLVEKENTPH